MPEFPVRLVPITGGYALHYAPCDHDDAEAPGRSRAMAVGSAQEALAEYHASLPTGLTPAARLVVRDCAANVPLHPIQPMSWQERHGHYMREAAYAIRAYTDQAVAEVRQGAAEIETSRYDADGRHDPVWAPQPKAITDQVRRAHLSMLMLNTTGGIKDTDTHAEKLLRQAEAVYQRELGVLAVDSTQYASDMDRAYAGARRAASIQYVNFVKHTLRKVVAHRTVRDALG